MEFWFRRESQAQRQHHHHQQQPCIADAFGDDVVALAVEKGNGFFLGGEDFMVDDLLDLGELETEEEEEEEEEEDGDDERHKETQQGGLGQGGGGGEGGEEEERGKEIVGAEAGEDNKKPDVSFEPEATPSCSPVSELSLPMHDGAELEWVSRIVDDSLSEFPTQAAAAAAATVAAAKAPDLLVEKLTHRQHQPPPVLKSKRSKRARTLSASSSSSNCSYSSSPSSWGGGAPLLLLDALPTSTSSSSSSSSCSSPLSSSPSPSLSSRFILAHHLFDHIPSLSSANTSSFLSKQNRIQNNPTMLKSKSKSKKKKRGRKPKAAAAVRQGGKGERRCSHCGVNKTPQWRAGPEGAKTLCNACGVRYKSGRLLPEYRPACSPTFISHIHSNSHRKVMEMRRSKEPQEQDDEQEAKGQDRLLLISSVA